MPHDVLSLELRDACFASAKRSVCLQGKGARSTPAELAHLTFECAVSQCLDKECNYPFIMLSSKTNNTIACDRVTLSAKHNVTRCFRPPRKTDSLRLPPHPCREAGKRRAEKRRAEKRCVGKRGAARHAVLHHTRRFTTRGASFHAVLHCTRRCTARGRGWSQEALSRPPIGPPSPQT